MEGAGEDGRDHQQRLNEAVTVAIAAFAARQEEAAAGAVAAFAARQEEAAADAIAAFAARLEEEVASGGARAEFPVAGEELRRRVVSFLLSPPPLPSSGSETAMTATTTRLPSMVDLLNIDLACRDFRALTGPSWNAVALSRFGLDGGKRGYMAGMRLLRDPVIFDVERDPGDEVGLHSLNAYGGASDGSSSVLVSIPWLYRDHPVRPDELVLSFRDAETLRHIRTEPLWGEGATEDNFLPMTVAICGRVGSEVTVVSGEEFIIAYRDGQRQFLRGERWENGAIRVLGCETHLVVVGFDRIFLYKPSSEGEDALLSFLGSVEIPGNVGTCWVEARWSAAAMANGSRDFAVDIGGGAGEGEHKVTVWRLHCATSSMEMVEQYNTNTQGINGLALGERHVVFCDFRKSLFVFDRRTGDLLHQGITDDNEFAGDLATGYLEIVGDLLFSTSCNGSAALCIWDMKSGSLLRKHNADMPIPQVNNRVPSVSGMVRLTNPPAFVILLSSGRVLVYAFPADEDERIAIRTIQQQQQL